MHACVTISLCVSEHLITISTLQSSRTESTWFNHLHQRLVTCIISKQNPILTFILFWDVLGLRSWTPLQAQTLDRPAWQARRLQTNSTGGMELPQGCPWSWRATGGNWVQESSTSCFCWVQIILFGKYMIGSYWVLVSGSSLKQHFWLGEQWPQQKAAIFLWNDTRNLGVSNGNWIPCFPQLDPNGHFPWVDRSGRHSPIEPLIPIRPLENPKTNR